MRTIFKYPIRIDDEQTVTMPKGARIISAQVQAGIVCLWAIVKPGAALNEHRRICIIGTGHELPDDGFEYIGTVQTPPLVWHIFERTA